MTTNPINYENNLTESFRENPLFTELTAAMGELFSPNIEHAREQLERLRYFDVEPYYASYNLKMIGLNSPILTFTDEEYKLLMRHIGTFIQTRGASRQFVNFISFIKNAAIEFTPLWAASLDDLPIDLVAGPPGPTILEGGNYFATPYYDIVYDINLAPGVDISQLRFLVETLLAPIHLVLRETAALEQNLTIIMIIPFTWEVVEDFGLPITFEFPDMPDSILDDTFVLDQSVVGY